MRSKVPLYVVAQSGANAESFHGNEQLVREGGVALRIALEPSSLDQAVQLLTAAKQVPEAHQTQLKLF